MTREQKLALILGFSLILIVGVLISDHLSRAQTEAIVADGEADRPLVVQSIRGVPPGMGEAGVLRAGRDRVEPVRPADRVMARVDFEPLPGVERDPVETGTQVDVAPIEPMPKEDELADAGAAREVPELLVLPGFEPVGDMGGPIARPTPKPVVMEEPEQVRVVEPEPIVTASVVHKVEKNETLYGIAQQYYGDGDLWPELAKANRDKVDEQGHVVVGVALTIPSRGGAPIRSQRGQSYSSYTVKPGDTLSEISQNLLGTVRRMDELIKLNRDKIRDADDIRVGMKLRYPTGQST
ncbi:MAG TPA: LysM peptidoglycan-binding domain-containing protein [Phycisphaerales bacterium]|nr:LysM peptidoglycan-binding domain-containing protein [Phycisphaerales bacterium]